MLFHWSLSDSKFPQISRTLLSIQTDLDNAVVWIVSTFLWFLSLLVPYQVHQLQLVLPSTSCSIVCLFFSYLAKSIYSFISSFSFFSFFFFFFCPVGWGCRIHRLLLCRGVKPPQRVSWYMTINNLMVRLQQCWSFGECGVPLHCHRSQVHSGPEW